jgi:uncharacterized protein DUF6644
MEHLLTWLQHGLGKGPGDDAQSWSETLLGSLHFWSILEGTHLLTLMLFVGTILVVDLRLMGVIFRRTPVSVISTAILPLTVFGFAFMLLTGLTLMFSKPLFYYHNIWFRIKMLLLVLAMINVWVFHSRIQKSQGAWDAAPVPPGKVRAAAAISLVSWIAMISCGRFIAYDWFSCGKPQSAFINAVEACQTSEQGAYSLQGKRLD